MKPLALCATILLSTTNAFADSVLLKGGVRATQAIYMPSDGGPATSTACTSSFASEAVIQIICMRGNGNFSGGAIIAGFGKAHYAFQLFAGDKPQQFLPCEPVAGTEDSLCRI